MRLNGYSPNLSKFCTAKVFYYTVHTNCIGYKPWKAGAVVWGLLCDVQTKVQTSCPIIYVDVGKSLLVSVDAS